MTDLDREIARLKGWRETDLNVYMHPVYVEIHKPKDIGDEVGATIHTREECNWSTSDAKAFELVDEIGGPLFFLERFGKAEEKKWNAHFSTGHNLKPMEAVVGFRDLPLGVRGRFSDFSGEGLTRPEAICRAYIAVRKARG